MGEIIQIHIGQAGVQIGNACWELYCLEHGIGADGCICDKACDNKFYNFFACKDNGRVTPRTILVDSEPTVVDQVRNGPYGRLFSPCSLITGKEDSGSNFARGYYTIGAELIDITMEAIRYTAEACENIRGFLLFRSIGGGTGSGLGNLIAERLDDEYEKILKMEFIIFPSPSFSPLIVEPYNTILATHISMDFMDCTFIIENEALYDICSSHLNIMAPKYKNLNRIIGQTVSAFTTPQRFSGSGNVSFLEFQTNLVPYPRIHFPVLSYAPFIPSADDGFTHFSTEAITTSSFDPSNQLVRCNPAEGMYMSCVLMYRGQVSDWAINNSMTNLRQNQTIRFVDWSPIGFKVGKNPEPPISVPCGGMGSPNVSLVAMSNNTVIQLCWSRVLSKFNELYSRRTFMHHFIAEGLDEDAMNGAYEDISALIEAYEEVESNSGTANIKFVNESFGKRSSISSSDPSSALTQQDEEKSSIAESAHSRRDRPHNKQYNNSARLSGSNYSHYPAPSSQDGLSEYVIQRESFTSSFSKSDNGNKSKSPLLIGSNRSNVCPCKCKSRNQTSITDEDTSRPPPAKRPYMTNKQSNLSKGTSYHHMDFDSAGECQCCPGCCGQEPIPEIKAT